MCRPTLRAILAAVTALGALSLALPVQADPPGWTITRLTDNEFDDYYPRVSGSNVAWESYDGDSYELFFYDGDTIRQVSDGNYAGAGNGPGFFHLSGSSVVWASQATTTSIDSEVFLFDGTTVRQLTDNDYNDGAPRVSDGNVVWLNETGVHFYDGTSTTKLMPSGADGWNLYTDISGSTVVWCRESNDDELEIFMAQPIPEPATLSLVALGGLVLLLRKRRA